MARARTHVTAALVAAAMVLAGCGRDSGGFAAGESAEPLGSGPISGEITMWAQGSEGEKLPELLKEFEAANPGVKVNVTPIPWDAAHSKYQTAIAGGTTPDVAMMGTTWMADFASAFEPAPTEIDTSGMFEGSKSSTVVNGTTYGVPWYVDTRVIYYRTDLAAQAGYSSPPATTLSVSYFTYNQFGFGNYGFASAASYVLFVAIALLSLVQFRAFRSRD